MQTSTCKNIEQVNICTGAWFEHSSITLFSISNELFGKQKISNLHGIFIGFELQKYVKNILFFIIDII